MSLRLLEKETNNMELVRWELSLGIVKGILFGVRQYSFQSQDKEVYEEDVVLYVGMIQIVLTLIYAKQ